MSVVTSEFEISSSLSASQLFKAYDEFDKLAPRVEPETFKHVVIVQGDGGAGTIQSAYLQDGLPFAHIKIKLDVVDSENYTISFTVLEGDVLTHGNLDFVTHHAKFVPCADGGCVYKHTVEYNCKGNAPLAEEFIKMETEGLKKTFKKIEAHILAN